MQRRKGHRGERTSAQTIGGVIARIRMAGDGGTISLAEVFAALDRRAYGPLVFVVGVIALSPLGAIPGASVVCAGVVILLALQMSLRRGPPWTPDLFHRIRADSGRAERALDRVEPYLKKVERLTRARWQWLFKPPGLHAVTAALCGLAVLMLPLALVPWGVMPVAFAITAIGLGLLTRDGILVSMGIAAAIAAGLAGPALYIVAI